MYKLRFVAVIGILSYSVLASVSGLAASLPGPTPVPGLILSTRSISNCDIWQFARADFSSGYMCFNHPGQVEVADGLSTQAAISQLEARIQALEARIHELTSQTQGARQ